MAVYGVTLQSKVQGTNANWPLVEISQYQSSPFLSGILVDEISLLHTIHDKSNNKTMVLS